MYGSPYSPTGCPLKDEALAKILCHNIVCLIHEMYELGIEPTFWEDRKHDTMVNEV